MLSLAAASCWIFLAADFDAVDEEINGGRGEREGVGQGVSRDVYEVTPVWRWSKQCNSSMMRLVILIAAMPQGVEIRSPDGE
ncbi:hypothetical protein VTJ04DRAFT_6590 [Mycothermus thermophilus]|uniref:uncharacterized protein n=1 Tax=Humicola insolens TaxID=85995 RepID=UPI0037425312